MLHESKNLFDDQLQALEQDSRKYGTQGEKLDFALLVDGLQAEREQGITIDVAYRFFATDRRRYIVADTPGHEQYTRNMATGASNAKLAILLIDARKGILSQTRRHHRIVTMMGIQHIVLAVNKMDLVGYEEEIFRTIEAEYRSILQRTRKSPSRQSRSRRSMERTCSIKDPRCPGTRSRRFFSILTLLRFRIPKRPAPFACPFSGSIVHTLTTVGSLDVSPRARFAREIPSVFCPLERPPW